MSLIPGGLNWLVVLGWLLSTATVRAASIDLTQTHFKLLSQDGSAVIGRATFEVVVQNGRRELVQGKYQFNNGEYDIDQDWLELRSRSTLPLLLRYRHAFFHSNGVPDRLSQADLKSGAASCTTYTNGHAATESAKLTFSADTYAGPAVMLPIRDFIRRGSQARAAFRDFTCAPGPKLYVVRIVVERGARWSLYPGELVEADITPELGWINSLVFPFVPKIRLWFNQAKGCDLIGAESSRYYKGLHFIMVNERSSR